MMLITYCGTLHILLLCCHPAASFTGVSTSISKALSTQQKSIRQKDSISCKYYQHRYFATAISSLSKEQSVNDRNASYTGLLVHYLTQNVKPKFYLCVNIISKIIKHDGPDSAIRIGELLENRISADSLRMTKNALLSALVLQKQTEPASSLLRQLLLQQNGHWQLDIAVVADLLQLYMAIDTDRDTTIMRRQYKKRALQASMIYANVIDVQAQSQYPISQSQMLMRNFTQERSRRSSELQLTSTSVAASDRIHEYGARALAVSRDWDEAVRAVACIGDTHLATPSLIIFNSELLERLVKLDVVSLQAPEAVTVGVDSALAKTTSSCRKTAVDSRTISLATELAMLQPLHLLATDCPMLQSSLLLLGTSSMHADRLIASLQDISDRGSGALPLFSPNTDLAASGNLLLPSRVSSMLLERMFLSGYRFYELAEAVRIIWGQNGNGSDSENSIYSTISEETAVSHTSEDKSLISPILKAVNGILRIACSIRDKRAEELKNDRNGTSQVPFDSDVTALIPIIGDALSSTCPRAELGFARALNPCLHLLFLSFQQTDMSSTRRSASVSQNSSLTSNILQAIMDETWTTSSWYPDTDLLADALQLPFPVLFPFQIIQDTSETRQLAVHEEVIAQVRRGDIPEAFVLFALFRSAVDSPSPALTAAATSLWNAIVERNLPTCYNSGPVLSAALSFSFSKEVASTIDNYHPHVPTSRGVKACCDAISVAVMSSSQQPSVTPHTERTFSVNNAVRTLFSALQDGAVLSQNSDSEIEDVPRAVLSVLQNKHTTGALRRESERGGVGGDQIFEKERETVMNLDLTNLIKGAVISVGGESPQSTGSDISAYKYSSLLRLALYLSAVPAEQLEILLPRLLKISEEWPKIILKAFSHLLSSSRATQDVSTSISFSSPDPELVQIVLQSFDRYLADMLGLGSLRHIELESDMSTEIGAVKSLYSEAIINLRKTRTVSSSFPTSDTLAAAIDLCSSSSSSDKGNHPKVDIDLDYVMQLAKAKDEEERFIQCKTYYTIGWLAAESDTSSLSSSLSSSSSDESSQRHLGVSLNQLSFALLRAIQRLSMPVSEAIQIVQQKIEYFTKRLPDSSISTAWDRDGDNGGAMTQITAAAVTYRETRLLSSLASCRGKEGRDELMAFWSSTLTVHPSLLNYSTALFELLDAHLGAENSTGVLLWGREAVKGGAMLPFMRVKDLLVRYSDTLSLHNLPALLPLLVKLSASHIEEEMEVRAEDRVVDTKPHLLEWYERSGMSGLSLPLSMSVLRDLCVKLLEQGRLNDASALLKCVHPLQWPYDELLFALATVVESDTGAVRNEKGSVGRKRECMAVMWRREELSVPLSAIKSSTARALLAMQTDTKPGSEKENTEEIESQQLFRLMVARAVKTVGTVTGSDTAKKSQVSSMGTDNHNGRSLKTSSTTNAISQDDVRSGLLALLTLYNLTDQAITRDSEIEIPLQVSKEEPLPPKNLSTTEEGAGTSSAPVLRWVDPESPENLSKFLLDVESLGSAWEREEQTNLPGSKGGCSKIASERSGEVQATPGNLGLRVSGSKKSWKRGGTFGLSFSKKVPSTIRVINPNTSPESGQFTIIDSSTVEKLIETDEESIDILICKELADSLFSTVTAQIATYRKEEAERIIKMDLELELMQLHSSEGNKVFEGAMTKSRRRPREVDRTGDSSISGATEELFSLENQPQADRLFSSYKHSEDLCFRLLQLCSLRPDTASAALVIEQMEYQKILLRGTDRDDVTWQHIHRIMVDGTNPLQSPSSSSNSGRITSAVWGHLKGIFVAVRPALLSRLQSGKDIDAEEGRMSEEWRTRGKLVDIMELGALSLLRSLLEDDIEMKRSGDGLPVESDELESEVRIEAEVGQHWMKEGERDKERERVASEVQMKDAAKLDALTSSRAQIMHLMQQLPQLGVPLSDGFGSQLISAFLLLGDVDSSLAILNILLRNGGHASDLACESLARYLLSDGRQAMARAICRLMHSRGRLCDYSFYSFLFASILAPAARIAHTPSSSHTSLPMQAKTNVDSTRDFDLRQGIDLEYSDSDSDDDVEGTSEGPIDDTQSMQRLPTGALDMSVAVAEALVLLGEIFSATATATATASASDGLGPSDSNFSSPSTREAKWRKVSSNLIEILVRLGYSGRHLETANIAILNLKRSRMA